MNHRKIIKRKTTLKFFAVAVVVVGVVSRERTFQFDYTIGFIFFRFLDTISNKVFYLLILSLSIFKKKKNRFDTHTKRKYR